MTMKVADVMTRDVISVAPDSPLREVARILSERRISGVPVVDDAGAVVGIVSEADLLPKQVSRPPSRRRPLEWIFGERHDPEELRRRAATTASEAMSAPAVTIAPDRPLREAAAFMVDRRMNRLPVVSDDGLVGMITRADLVRAYVRLDEEIVDAIREEVLRDTMWLDPDRFDIAVREGRVKISGTVDRRSTARIIKRLVGLVDGVTEVVSDIGWEFDDTDLEPVGELEPEPGASSITKRRRPQPLHR
jgi:CBS domain-containing protein